MGGKLFAVIVILIALASAVPIIHHTFLGATVAPPEDISTHGAEIDKQLDETMIEAGLSFLGALRTRPDRARFRVILMSADQTVTDLDAAPEVVAVLQKPFEPSVLLELLDRYATVEHAGPPEPYENIMKGRVGMIPGWKQLPLRFSA